jgi:hypothetical protein
LKNSRFWEIAAETGFDLHCVAELAVQIAKFSAWPPVIWDRRVRTASDYLRVKLGVSGHALRDGRGKQLARPIRESAVFWSD